MKYSVKLLFFLIMSTGLCLSQSNVIDNFPLLSQNGSLEDYPNDCGEWAVASILSYWNVNGYFPYTEFDRFLGKDVDPNMYINRPLITEMAVQLQDPLGYIPNASNGSFGTNPLQMQQGIITFCNSDEFGNNYDFIVGAYNNSNPFNNNSIWERIRNEIDNGRPVLFLVTGTITARTDYSDWRSYNLWHYMPVYGYYEDMEGRRTLVAASLGSWNSIVYLDIESASNTAGGFPDIWTILPQKDNTEIPLADIYVELESQAPVEAVALHSNVSSASMIDHVEYEVNLYGEEWTSIGQGTDGILSYEVIYSTTGVQYAERVWFRSRAMDYFNNYSEWSYSDSYYTIINAIPAVNGDDIPTSVTNLPGGDVISIFPNPASGIINIIPALDIQSGSIISIFDGAGKLVYSNTINSLSTHGSLEVDLSSFPPGFYYIVLHSSGSNRTGKFIKR